MESTLLEKAHESGEHGQARLRAVLSHAPELLMEISPERASIKPAANKWSSKQELGHLLDSASNNHQRIVRAQLHDNPEMAAYDGDSWVELHGYQQRDWHELIAIWRALNRQLLAAAEAVPDSAWSRTCTIGPSAPLTIGFVLEDYVEHMLHHLRHIGIAVAGFVKDNAVSEAFE